MNELRCMCSRRPLLATYGIDKDGRLFVHVKVYKQSRLFGEVVAYGDVKLRCRECLRWHQVKFPPNGSPRLEPTQAIPPSVRG